MCSTALRCLANRDHHGRQQNRQNQGALISTNQLVVRCADPHTGRSVILPFASQRSFPAPSARLARPCTNFGPTKISTRLLTPWRVHVQQHCLMSQPARKAFISSHQRQQMVVKTDRTCYVSCTAVYICKRIPTVMCRAQEGAEALLSTVARGEVGRRVSPSAQPECK